MKDAETDTLIKVIDPEPLFDPLKDSIKGCDQSGQEEQSPVDFAKTKLVFPSGESLPRCWVDPDYQLSN
ncbi:MAG TPA: acetyltransferase [Leptolyngbyaceae cyanobacterium]